MADGLKAQLERNVTAAFPGGVGGGGGGSVTAASISDAGAAGRDVLKAATNAAIKAILALGSAADQPASAFEPAIGTLPITKGGTGQSSLPRLDQAPAPAADVAMNGQRLTGLGAPTSDTDAVTRTYVDAVAQGLAPKLAVRAATTANVTLSGTQTVDGVALVNGNRVLVKNQTASAENGIYVVGTPWTRATDTDTFGELVAAYTLILEGTTQGLTGWVSQAGPGGTLGTTAVPWAQFSASGNGVASFKGRTGTIVPEPGDYTAAQITNTPSGSIAAVTLQGAVDELGTEKAPLASPALVTPTRTTPPAASDNTLALASTAWVQGEVGPDVSPAERTAGTATARRRFTPDDIKAMVTAHAPSAGAANALIATAAPATALSTTEVQIGTITITPSSVTAKILLIAVVNYTKDATTTARIFTARVRRGTTNASTPVGRDHSVQTAINSQQLTVPIPVVDIPGVTTPVTYTVRGVTTGTGSGGTGAAYSLVAVEASAQGPAGPPGSAGSSGTDIVSETAMSGVLDTAADQLLLYDASAAALRKAMPTYFAAEVTSRALGLLGDGTDTSAAIQAALDAGAGRTIRVLPGTYTASGLTITGARTKLVFEPGTYLKLEQTGAGNRSLLSVRAPEVLIRGGDWDWNHPLNTLDNMQLIRVEGGPYDAGFCRIKDCTFRNVNANAAVVYCTIRLDHPHMVSVQNLDFVDCEQGVLATIYNFVAGGYIQESRGLSVDQLRSYGKRVARVFQFTNSSVETGTDYLDYLRSYGASITNCKAINYGWTGSVLSATATTTTLDAAAPGTTILATKSWLKITAGLGKGQVRLITAWNGGTKVATHAAWAVNPDTTSKYRVWKQGDLAIEFYGADLDNVAMIRGSAHVGAIAANNYAENFDYAVSFNGVHAGVESGNIALNVTAYAIEVAASQCVAQMGNVSANTDLPNTVGCGIGFTGDSYGSIAVGNVADNLARGSEVGTRGNLVAGNVLAGSGSEAVWAQGSDSFVIGLNAIIKPNHRDGVAGANDSQIHVLQESGPGIVGMNLFGEGFVGPASGGLVMLQGQAGGVPDKVLLALNNYPDTFWCWREWANGGTPTGTVAYEPMGTPYHATTNVRSLAGSRTDKESLITSETDPPTYPSANGTVALTPNGRVYVRRGGAWVPEIADPLATATGSSFTPDGSTGTDTFRYTLSAATTIAAPTNLIPGKIYTFQLIENVTGGFAVSWNAAYVFHTAWSNTGNTANKVSIIQMLAVTATTMRQAGAQQLFAT